MSLFEEIETRSYSAMALARSSLQVIVTNRTRSSLGNLHFKFIDDPHNSPNFPLPAIRSLHFFLFFASIRSGDTEDNKELIASVPNLGFVNWTLSVELGFCLIDDFLGVFWLGYDNERRDDRLEDCGGSSGGSGGELRREERRGGAEVCGVGGIGEFGGKCEKEGRV